MNSRIFYKSLYMGNNLNTTKPAEGYSLIDRDSKKIMKYGETTPGNKRIKNILMKIILKWTYEARGST